MVSTTVQYIPNLTYKKQDFARILFPMYKLLFLYLCLEIDLEFHFKWIINKKLD